MKHIWNNAFQDIGHQTTKENDLWEVDNRQGEPYCCPNVPEKVSRHGAEKVTEAEASGLPDLKEQSWETEEAKATRIHRSE